MVTTLTEGYAVVTGFVGGVPLRSRRAARSSRLLMRGSRERVSRRSLALS